MNEPSSPLQTLSRIAQVCQRSTDDSFVEFGDRAARYCAGEFSSLDEALLETVRQNHWGEDRNNLLRMAHRNFFPFLSNKEAGEAIAGRLAGYNRNTWAKTRTTRLCPHEGSSLNAALWHILKCRDRVLTGDYIRTLLGSNLAAW